MARFADMFDSINSQVVSIAADVGQTPQDFHSGVFSMIRSLSENAILPIAGMILTFVLTYELIQVIIQKNNMHEFDTFDLFKWIFKTFVAVYILTNTFVIVMAVFSLAQHTINTAAGSIVGNMELGAESALTALEAQLREMGIWQLIGLWLETWLINICLWVMSIYIFFIIYGRMIEIFMVVSIAPIPLSTMVNREWGTIGNNYLKSLFALAFQGFLIMVCVAIYAALVQSIPAAPNIHIALWGVVGYTFLLCNTLNRTASLSKSLFNAH
jgi:hypothetical protein